MPWPDSASQGAADTRPREGCRPTTPHQAAGPRVEPPISDAWASGTTPAATAAAAPPDEPLVEYPRFHGLCVSPCRRVDVTIDIENSGVALRPTRVTPDRRTSVA